MKGWVQRKLSGVSYKYYLIAGVSLVVFAVAAFFFMFNLHNSKKAYVEEVSQSASFDAANLASRIDERLNTFEMYYISAMSDDGIKWILNNDFDYSDYSRYKAAMDILSTRKMFTDYLSTYSLTDYRSGWVISKKGLLKRTELLNPDAIDELYRKSEKLGLKRFWNYTQEEANTNNSSTVDPNARIKAETDGLCLVMRLPFDSINTHATAVIKINMKTWEKWVNEELSEGETIIVCDENGNVIMSGNTEFNAYASDIAMQEGANRSYIYKTNDIEYAVAEAASNVLGWHYIIIKNIDKKLVFGNASQWIVMAVLVIAIAALFTAAAYVIYRPINGMVEEVAGETPVSGNEFKYISNRLTMLKDDKLALENMVKNQQTNIEEMLERRLINEGIKSNEEWEDYFESLSLKDYKCFSTVVSVLDLRNEDPRSVLDEDAICLEIIQKMPKELKGLLWMSPIYNSSAVFAVVGADEENELLSKVMEFYEGLTAFAMKTTGLGMLSGVSSACHSHKHFRRAYMESVSALTKQGYEEAASGNENEVSTACRFYIASKPSLTGNSYSNSFENDIRIAVKDADRRKAYRTTDRFCEFLATVTESDVATLYIMRYINSIVFTGMEANINPEEVFTDGIRQNYREVLNEVEPRQVRKYIKRCFIDPIFDVLTEKMQNDSYNVMEAIDSLLERTKGNLLLAECADELGVHQTYIWKVLKMEKGKSFTEYAEKYKIEEAKKLLLETNMSVQEIAAALDYANPQNFIRFFSKVTGVTPGKYRKLY